MHVLSCLTIPWAIIGYTHVRGDDVDGLVRYFDVAQADNANRTIGWNRQTEFGKWKVRPHDHSMQYQESW